ncbi:MAG: hypothetical protein JJV98_01030 [Desulfosarcina sp.]|nr:hypothetical protein [Desulfobacterales bacterium]
MIRLEVPFIPEEGYVQFLVEQGAFLSSVYFSLYTDPVADSRYRFDAWCAEDLRRQLPCLQDLHKYALINSRFYRPDIYDDPEIQGDLIRVLEMLLQDDLLDGIVFSDFYFLNALAARAPDLAAGMEAVPGVNCQIDTAAKLDQAMDLIRAAGFRRPGKIVLDRSLNRRPEALADLVTPLQRRYPKTVPGLIANEGCLPDCLFKPAHDAHIALGNMRLTPENTHRLNSRYGCFDVFRRQPERIFQSPFIRPEDIRHYEGTIRFVKIAGRTLGTSFLRNVVRAYVRRNYHGNLLELMDTLHELSDQMAIANHRLPIDFWEQITACGGHCSGCDTCRHLATRVQFQPFRMRDLRR